MIYPNGQVHLTSLGGSTYTFPTTVTVGGIQRTWRSHTARLADGSEVHVAGPFPQPFDLPIVGSLHSASEAAAQARADTIMAVLNDAPVEVRLSGVGSERFITAVPRSLNRQDLGLGVHHNLSILLRSMEPYWLGEPVVETFAGLTTSPSYHSVNGVVGTVRPNPVITFTFTTGASVSNPRIYNASSEVNLEFQVPGLFQQGDVLVVDTENMRVYDSEGVNYLDQMGDDFLLKGWPLELGSNSLSIYGSGTVRMDVAVAYRPKWV